MIPPDKSCIYEGRDKDDMPWLLYWDLPGAPDVWSALGLDDRRYPAVRTLSGSNLRMIGSCRVVRHMESKVSVAEVKARARKRAGG